MTRSSTSQATPMRGHHTGAPVRTLLIGLIAFLTVIDLFGTGAILATVLFQAISLLVGYLLGGPGTDTKRVLALGTGVRNLSAAFVIATGNFADQPNVLIFLAAAGFVGMFITFPTAAEFGKRSESTPESEEPLVSRTTSGAEEPPVSTQP